MLRLTVLVLALLNALYLAWGQGWLQAYGLAPVTQREPQRLSQQVRPDAIVSVSLTQADQISSVDTAPTASPQCLRSSVLDEAQVDAVRAAAVAALPDGAWLLEGVPAPERWIVYMGKYANAAELEKKREQLANLHLNFEALRDSSLAPGLSLGVYTSQALANAALEALSARGVRTARVVQEQGAAPAYRLRLPEVDERLQKQLAPVTAALAGQTLLPCPMPVTVSK